MASDRYNIRKETVLKKLHKLYGDKYLVTMNDIEDSKSKVLCKCNIHGTSRYVNVRHLSNGDSCPCKECVSEANNELNRKIFIERLNKEYGDSYSFDNLNYTGYKNPGTLTCKKHGDFELPQLRYAFDNIPCPICYEEDRKNKRNEDFFKRLKEKYGDRYQWITTEFGDYYTDYVEFICPDHGVVKQTLCVLLNTQDNEECGCPKCRKERANRLQSYTLEEAIEKAKSLECTKYYDFSNITEWFGVKHKYKFKCVKHDREFEQTFDSIFSNKGNGCPDCYAEYIRERDCLGKERFVEKAIKVHGNKFDYSKAIYVNYTTPIIIICPKHGEFLQTPGDHLSGHGCPKCNNSKLEEKVRVALEKNNIAFVQEKYVKDLTDKVPVLKMQRVDFFIPELKICIECQGVQHFTPSKFSTKTNDSDMLDEYKKRKKSDELKYNELTNSGHDVIYFTEKKI